MKIGNLEVYGVIYKIENLVNGKVYIGQTINGFNERYSYKGNDIERVYLFHKSNKDKHRYYNKHLLNSIIKYGNDAFKVNKIFDIAFSKEELDIKEQIWISVYKSYYNEYGYNRNLGGTEGIPNEHSKMLISLNHTDVKGENNVSAIINENLAEEIKIKLSNGFSIIDISMEYNLPQTLIENIKHLKSWRYIREDLNDKITNYIKRINSKQQQEINRKNIITLYNQGLNWKQILELNPNISKNTITKVIKVFCIKNNLTPTYIKDNTERNEKVVSLYNKGYSRKEISLEIDVEISVINGIIRRYMKKINNKEGM